MMFVNARNEEEYKVALKAIQDLRAQRTAEAAQARAEAAELVENAVEEALTMVEPEDLTDIIHNLYLRVNDMIVIH